jgi:hypothetical protein
MNSSSEPMSYSSVSSLLSASRIYGEKVKRKDAKHARERKEKGV